MNKELEEHLYTYLGELIYQKENAFDYGKDIQITSKINAVYKLLGIDKEEESKFFKLIQSIKFEIIN